MASRKFGREIASRQFLLKSLANSLIKHEKIVTTEAKAQTLRPYVEKIITKSMRDSPTVFHHVLREITEPEVARKAIEVFPERYKNRPGGYTRVRKLGFRRGDGAPLAAIELLPSLPEDYVPPPRPTKLPRHILERLEEEKQE